MTTTASTVSAPGQVAGPLVRRRARAALVGGGAVLALAGIATVHLGQGSADVGLTDLLRLASGASDANTESVLLGSRLPRLLAGAVAGVALGVSGALVQAATRNPLAAPDTLGVNAGAYLAVVAVAVTGLNIGVLPRGAAAFTGGAGAAAVVYLLTARGPMAPGRVLLAGAAVMFAASSAATALMILNEQQTQGLFFWGQGSLLQAGLSQPVTVGVIVAFAMIALPFFARPLDLVALGDETAESMGVRVGRLRLLALGVSVLFAACAVTVAGPIGFVGLIAPIVVRMAGIRRHAALLPISGLLGAALVLAADTAARMMMPASAGYGEVPAGIVTALLGGPLFVLLARQVPTGDAETGAAVTVSRPRTARSYTLVVAAVAVVLTVGVAVSLRLGDVAVSWSQIAATLTGGGDELTRSVVAYRVPRIAVAAAAGACLAAAGTAIQAVVRNPLAEPGLIGVTGGAAIGAVGLITLFPAAPMTAIPVAAAVGGIVTMLAVVAIAGPGRRLDPTRVVLVGIGVAAFTAAVVQMLALRAEMAISAALTWLAGSTYARDLDDLGWLVLPLLLAAVLVVASRPLDLLGLGDDLPRALGLPLPRVRALALGGAAVLAAGTAAAVGTVGFVGLVAPHLARRLVGAGHRRLVPLAALLGAVLVVAADAAGRSVLAPREIPVGVVTALIGTPYLIWLLHRQEATR